MAAVTRKPNKIEDLLKKELVKELHNNRALLLIRQHFIGMLAMRMDLIPVVDDRLPTASTDGNNIFVNVNYYRSLNEKQQVYLIAHEIWHCVFLHFIRKGSRDHQRFNYAADLEVDFMLKEQGFEVTDLLPHDKAWKGLSAEEIYEKLKDHHKRNEKTADVHIYEGDTIPDDIEETEGDGKNDIVFDPDYSPALSPGTARQWRTRVISAAQQISRRRGTLPDYLKRIIKDIYEPELNWKQILQQFVLLHFGGERRWLPPNKRYAYRKLFLPSGKNSFLSIVVAIDTSGSTISELPYFLSELKGIVSSFSRYEITLLECDTEIKKVTKYNEWQPLDYNNFEFTGFGGTDFRPVFEYININMEKPKLLVFLTDGAGEAPGTPPDYPVLWVITGDGHAPVNWGWKTFLKKH
jgi:predicted metal-dependent peptidase